MKRLVLPGLVAAAALLVLATIALAGGMGPSPSVPSDRVTQPAPIDGIEIVSGRSLPPQYAVVIKAGLPSGCAKPHSHSLRRSGDTITVTVLNSFPSGDPICTMIYGMYDLTIDLGSDFEVGRTYTVRVNDQETTFRP